MEKRSSQNYKPCRCGECALLHMLCGPGYLTLHDEYRRDEAAHAGQGSRAIRAILGPLAEVPQ